MDSKIERDDQEKVLIEKVDVLTEVKEPQNFPWPYEDESVKEITCVGVLEFVPGKLRGKFMDEIYRILVPSGKASFAVVYWNTARGAQDYLYEYPPLCEQSFLYFNKGWRDANKIERDLKCNFSFTYGYSFEAETAARNEESRGFYIKRYTNCVDVLHLMLTKLRPDEIG